MIPSNVDKDFMVSLRFTRDSSPEKSTPYNLKSMEKELVVYVYSWNHNFKFPRQRESIQSGQLSQGKL